MYVPKIVSLVNQVGTNDKKILKTRPTPRHFTDVLKTQSFLHPASGGSTKLRNYLQYTGELRHEPRLVSRMENGGPVH